jgi:hypothetical protein
MQQEIRDPIPNQSQKSADFEDAPDQSVVIASSEPDDVDEAIGGNTSECAGRNMEEDPCDNEEDVEGNIL